MKSMSDRTSRGPLEAEHNAGLLLSVCVCVCVHVCSIYKSISILASIFLHVHQEHLGGGGGGGILQNLLHSPVKCQYYSQ